MLERDEIRNAKPSKPVKLKTYWFRATARDGSPGYQVHAVVGGEQGKNMRAVCDCTPLGRNGWECPTAVLPFCVECDRLATWRVEWPEPRSPRRKNKRKAVRVPKVRILHPGEYEAHVKGVPFRAPGSLPSGVRFIRNARRDARLSIIPNLPDPFGGKNR
jgi:hypothetical protein